MNLTTGLGAALLLALLALTACDGDDDTNITSAGVQRNAQLRAEAEQHCPPAALEECAERYVELSQNLFETALCVNAAGDWYFETPLGDVGDDCSIREARIVAIVGAD